MWPCVKSNAYGHGAILVSRYLVSLGYDTLGVADVDEGIALAEAGIDATFIIFPESLPEQSETIVAQGFQPAVSNYEVLESLSQQAVKRRRVVSVHVKVDTGMARIGLQPEQLPKFLERCRELPGVHVRALMSHFACADEADKTFSHDQIERFEQVAATAKHFEVDLRHMANSAAILDLPTSHFDAVRPGIAVYGLRPSAEIVNPRVNALRPILDWKTRVTFLKEVPGGTGLSYGHTAHTRGPSLIATLPVGYADGLSRNLSNRTEVLVHGRRCPQVGRITMNLTLIDVTSLRGRVAVGDEVVIVGRQGESEISADELAEKLGTINYEVVTGISYRVPRLIANEEANE